MKDLERCEQEMKECENSSVPIDHIVSAIWWTDWYIERQMILEEQAKNDSEEKGL